MEAGDALAFFVDGQNVGGLAGGEGGGLVLEAGHGGGVEGEEAESVVERCAGETDEIFESAVEGEDTAGEDAVGGGFAVGDLNVETAELVSAVGHSGGAHGVSDEEAAVTAFHLPPDFYYLRRYVDPIADEFGEERIIGEDGGENAGVAVVDGAHGVEGVSCADGSGGDGGQALGGGCVGVADGDADAAGDGMGGEFDGAGQLGCEGDEAGVAFRGVDHFVEGGDVGFEEMSERLNTAAGVGEEWTFKMDADGAGLSWVGGRVEKFGQSGDGAEGEIHGRGDGGGEVTAGSARGEKATDGGESGGGCLHCVVSGCAVEMDIEKCGRECVTGEVNALVGGGLGGLDAGFDAGDAAVFDEKDGEVDEGGAGPEVVSGDESTHMGIITGTVLSCQFSALRCRRLCAGPVAPKVCYVWHLLIFCLMSAHVFEKL